MVIQQRKMYNIGKKNMFYSYAYFYKTSNKRGHLYSLYMPAKVTYNDLHPTHLTVNNDIVKKNL